MNKNKQTYRRNKTPRVRKGKLGRLMRTFLRMSLPTRDEKLADEYSYQRTMENLEDLGEIAGNFYSHLFTCFSIFQTILDGLAKFQCSPNILTMKKIGSNSIFLYSQYYEKTYFSLPPIAVEIPALMDRSSQAISKNTILW